MATTTGAATAQAPTEQSVRDLATRWYQALDRHDDIDSVLPFLIDDGLKLVFPEGTSYGYAGFRAWYAAVTNRFFDEVHTLREARITSTSGAAAEVEVVVEWRAKVWNPPAARSEWLGFEAYQTWTVVADPAGTVRISAYVVDELRPMPGSAPL